MGQNSGCCNPTSQTLDIESLPIPKELFTAEPTLEAVEQFIEPAPDVLETLSKG